VKRRLLRLVPLALVAACAGAVCPALALTGVDRHEGSARSDLKPLWSAFPLGQPREAADRKNTALESKQAQSRRSFDSGGSGRSTFPLLLAVAIGTLMAAVLAALGFGVLRPVPSLERRRRGRARSAPRPSFRPTKGGSSMSNFRRKLRAFGEPVGPPEESEEQSVGGGSPKRPVERLVEYSLKGPELTEAGEGSEKAAVEQVADEKSESPEAEAAADLSAVAEEVGTVLKSAQEAAAQMRRKAQDEAERLRKQAESRAAAEAEEARRVAEAHRAEASRIRAKADAYAKDTRAAADSFAEQRRSKAVREAAQIIDEARRRLAAADADVKQKVRRAEADVRQRSELLQAEIQRYEDRLENILVVFRGMGSQLEDLLGKQRTESSNLVKASDGGLEDALQPGASKSRAG
jgi:chemotaxis protein histidine kinase CheA